MAVGDQHQGTAARLFPSPLRYPGGKRKLANFVKLVLLQNGLVGCEYVEPYAGGASVALSLLLEDYADHVHINDLNRSVFAFWSVVLNKPDELCRRISSTEVSTAEWHRQRLIQDAVEPDVLDLAFSTFFLNRTSRSGIICGGMIGGQRQTGKWKLDARYNKTDLITRIERIARFRSRITLTGIDTAVYLRTHLPEVQSAFTYLDPPYYVKGAGLYQHFYTHKDHVEIAGLVRQLTIPWLVSYDTAPEIDLLYAGHTRIAYDLSYSAGEHRHRGSEVMFMSESLDRPDVSSPASIPTTTVDKVRIGG